MEMKIDLVSITDLNRLGRDWSHVNTVEEK
jgi:hypothetical protein